MSLSWDRFEQLEGDARHNFEILIRALVRHRWGGEGVIRDRLNQPGVEFHMRLARDCELGDAGRWFGWQCKYYRLPASKKLGTTRRREIECAIRKAKADVPDLTDFVLCLHELPTSTDLNWYHGELQTEVGPEITLHHWGPEDIESYLTGDAEILKATYFGELIFTREKLARCHERSIQPIRTRWVPELHVVTHVEETVDGLLLRPQTADYLRPHAADLKYLVDELATAEGMLSDEAWNALGTLREQVLALADQIEQLAVAVDEQRPDLAADLFQRIATPQISVIEARRRLRPLRSLSCPAAHAASILVATVRRGLSAVQRIGDLGDTRLLGIVGNAGSGKSHLGAQLTAPNDARPGGVFIRAIGLREGATLDELAVRIPELAVDTFEALLGGLDAAGARDGARLPIVIDGLNESQRPADWHDLLAQLVPSLSDYPNVRIILTYRGAVEEAVGIHDIRQVALQLDALEVEEAAEKYFAHYKISPGDAYVPTWLFYDMLFLRLYCEAANPDARQVVGSEALPRSLVGVFDSYVAGLEQRMRNRPGHPALAPGYVLRKLGEFGTALWERDARELPWVDAKELFDGNQEVWDDSLLRALLEEGILIKDDSEGLGTETVAGVFDYLAGYLIARSLTDSFRRLEGQASLTSATLWAKLVGASRHPLADDIYLSLVGLLPREQLGHLWKVAPEPERQKAILNTMFVESELLDNETLDELAAAIPAWELQNRRGRTFEHLWETRDAVDHQLNAKFLDRVLRSVTLAERDRIWSEYIRESDVIRETVRRERVRWEAEASTGEPDKLRALALSWVLTSTNRRLRDEATLALQRLGRDNPGSLLNVCEGLLDVDDPYVVERAVAAAYGALTAWQMPTPGRAFERHLGGWLEALARSFLSPGAVHPTSHALIRSYVAGSFELAGRLHPAAVPDGIDPSQLDFAPGPVPDPIFEGDEPFEEVRSTTRMDFSNYTVGGLYQRRSNYDMTFPQYVQGMAEIHGRIWELGWRLASHGEIDKNLSSSTRYLREAFGRAERYGKKYGWIAYYELAGRLGESEANSDLRRPREGVWPDIDPTFPQAPKPLGLALPNWATIGPEESETWIVTAETPVPDELLQPAQVNGEPGPWLLIEGFLKDEDPIHKREVWGFAHAVLISGDDVGTLAELLKSRPYLGNNFVDKAPGSYDVFAGEIPWSRRFTEAASDGSESAYDQLVGGESWADGYPVEFLAHGYNFPTEQSETVFASGSLVPSARFAINLSLRQYPGTLNLVGLDGRFASLTLTAPDGWSGHLLYLRRDLVELYAGGRKLLQIAWGEREVRVSDFSDVPEWLSRAHGEHRNLWRRIENPI